MQKRDERQCFTFKLKGMNEEHCIPNNPTGLLGSMIIAQVLTDDELHAPSKEELATDRGRLKCYFDDDGGFETWKESIAEQKMARAGKMKKSNPKK
tara:strand:- start:513 stop:800 length:288 start_codon:yes stop_codon:yes gene_type:complete